MHPLRGHMDEFFGCGPTWYVCPTCGVKHSMMGECYDCMHGTLSKRDRDERIRAGVRVVPERYRLPLKVDVLKERGVSAHAVAKATEALRAHRVVLLSPTTGHGKSSLLGAMACAAVARNSATVAWVPSYELAGDAFALPESWTEADIVALDDLGNDRDMKSNLTQSLLEQRYAEQRALWVSTALTEAEMAKRYGTNNVRRIFEGATVIRLGKGAM